MKKIIMIIFCSLAAFNVSVVEKIQTAALTKYGDIAQIAIPLIAAGTTVVTKDWEGSRQFLYSFGSTMATTTLLKHTVKEDRPKGKPKSFPSGHAAAAFVGAAFIQMRYGWFWGVPAYLAASLVGYSRVKSNNHWWWDCIASAVIGIGFNLIFTKAYSKKLRKRILKN